MTGITRRKFIKGSLVLSGAVLAGPGLIPLPKVWQAAPALAVDTPDLSVVTGRDWAANTKLAVERLGGMERFVRPGYKVALLANVPFKNYGAQVKPEILKAVIDMCRQAGAKEISFIKEPADSYAAKYKEEMESLKPGWEDSEEVLIPGGKSLKDANIRPDLLKADVFINVSIAKQHDGVGMSCTLKNMMGASTTMTNLWMHFGGKKRFKMYPDPAFLAQCIADLNLIRKPDLCIADATEFITENGPYGPGPLKKPQQIVAGIQPTLVDAYCATLLDLVPEKVEIIRRASAHGLGSLDLEKANILHLAQG